MTINYCPHKPSSPTDIPKKIYLHVRKYVRTYVRIYCQTYVYIYTYVRTYVCILYIRISIYVRIYVYVRIRIFLYVRTYPTPNQNTKKNRTTHAHTNTPYHTPQPAPPKSNQGHPLASARLCPPPPLPPNHYQTSLTKQIHWPSHWPPANYATRGTSARGLVGAYYHPAFQPRAPNVCQCVQPVFDPDGSLMFLGNQRRAKHERSRHVDPNGCRPR